MNNSSDPQNGSPRRIEHKDKKGGNQNSPGISPIDTDDPRIPLTTGEDLTGMGHSKEGPPGEGGTTPPNPKRNES